jgi:hypothetical protein
MGLDLDSLQLNRVLFAACARSGNPLAQQPMMVGLGATDGKILANLPLAEGPDGAVFNPPPPPPGGGRGTPGAPVPGSNRHVNVDATSQSRES